VLSEETRERLIPRPLAPPEQWDERYPPRDLPAGAEVTRFAPSPTGYVHIGSIYVSLIAQSVAHASGGVFFVRVENTDRAREVADAGVQLERGLSAFGLLPDEDDPDGPYAPYRQSDRQAIYDSYVAELLDADRAYPCFCTREELTETTKAQQAAGVPTGYWGRWARCRHLDENAVRARLDEGAPYVIRFRAPEFEGQRVSYHDRIRGELELEDNRNDTVIRKSMGLPTYHFAHAVDDHLMRVTTVIRGDEWISSVPLHLQLFDALGFTRIGYAHIAPLMKQEGKSKRKLSKRKDDEANVDFYLQAGYPVEGIRCYLRGTANSRLIDRPCAETEAEPIVLEQCSASGALVDLPKLEQICRDYVAGLGIEEVVTRLTAWAATYDPSLATALAAEPDVAARALAVEQAETGRPRKNLAKWSDFRDEYGFLLPGLFEPVTDPADERFAPLDGAAVGELVDYLMARYEHDGDSERWFGQIRAAAEGCGFAPGVKQFKAEPDRYRGSIREASNTFRVLLTGSRFSPDLFEVSRALGNDEVRRRLSSLG
jgi:glutamyl-tRNA synthetase